MSDVAPTPPLRTAPLHLWRAAAAFLNTLHALFGAPEDVAAKHTLTAKAYGFMAGWLRCAEAMLRRLVAIEAAAYPKPNTRPLLHAPRKRPRKLMGFDAAHPEKWRVSFRCFSSPARGGSVSARGAMTMGAVAHSAPSVAYGDTSPACGGGKRAARWDYTNFKPVTFRSAWPLAERYEALLRVFNDPTAYARRLARRLHATPHRLVEALRAPLEAAHRIDCFEALSEHLKAAWPTHFSSA